MHRGSLGPFDYGHAFRHETIGSTVAGEQLIEYVVALASYHFNQRVVINEGGRNS